MRERVLAARGQWMMRDGPEWRSFDTIRDLWFSAAVVGGCRTPRGAVKRITHLYWRFIMARIMKKSVNVETMSITFSFANGESYTADVSNYPEHIKDRLMMHGAAQKLGDTCAGQPDGDWMELIMQMDERLSNGEWGAERGSGLEQKLVEAEERLAAYIAMSDDEKRVVATLGVNRTALEKVVTAAKKAIDKRDAKK